MKKASEKVFIFSLVFIKFIIKNIRKEVVMKLDRLEIKLIIGLIFVVIMYSLIYFLEPKENINNNTTNEKSEYDWGYWTMSAYSGYSAHAWFVNHGGYLYISGTSNAKIGARAVVEISK